MSNLAQSEDSLSEAELERLKRLAEQTEGAEPWIPQEPGDTLAGKVLRWEVGHKRGEPETQCAVLILRTSGGDRAFYCWHAAARYKLVAPKEALGPDRDGVTVPPASRLARVGDFVAISYRGKSMMDSGNEAASYSVAIERSQPSLPGIEAQVEPVDAGPGEAEQGDASRAESSPFDDEVAPF